MNESKEKIRETRFVLFIPLLITAICAWFDLWLFEQNLELLTIFKTIYAYFFPSISSSMVTLIIQKAVYNDNYCSIADNRIVLSSLSLIFYSVFFLSCLAQFNLISAIVFGVISVIYMIITWFFCLDRKITHALKDPISEERCAYRKAIGE